MNAIPEKQPGQSVPSRANSRRLAEAMVDQAQARSLLVTRQESFAKLNAEGAEDFTFTWQTPDEREAELRIYYYADRADEVMAAELIAIDFRQPTVQERMRYELEFESELQAGGDLWSHVASHLWERAQ